MAKAQTETNETETVETQAHKFDLSGQVTVLIPISTGPSGEIVPQRMLTVSNASIPEGAEKLGEPAPVQANGEMVLVSNTGGVVRVPAADLKDYPGYARAVEGVHF
jgi:hypothetical protein